MTVTTTNVQNVLVGNGSTVAFPFTFDYQDAGTVSVWRNMPGAAPVLVSTSLYTLTAATPPAVGGTVTFGTAPLNTEVITIRRSLPLTQQQDIANQGGFFPAVVTAALDRAAMIDQQLQDGVGRSVRAPELEPGLAPLPAASARAGRIVGFDGAGALTTYGYGPPSDVSGAFVTATGSTTPRSLAARFADTLLLPDYTDATAAMNAIPAAGAGVIAAPRGVVWTPVSQAGKIVTWQAQATDSRAVLDSAGTRTGGFFSDYDCQGAVVLVSQMRQDQSAIAGGGFRDLLFCNVVDNDTANYTTVGQKVTMAVRGLATGAVSGGVFQQQYKDIVGADFHAIGRIDWPARGVSGIATGAIQYGRGIASNEFSVENPVLANEQSESMAAVQAILRAHKGDAGASNLYYGVISESNQSKLATAGVVVISTPHATDPTRDGAFIFGLDLGRSTVRDAAIRMPASRAGNSGTIIEYDPNDYSAFDRTNNRFLWVVGGAVPLFVTADGIGANTVPGAASVTIAAGTATRAQILMTAGVAPSSPVDGQFWYNGTNLQFRAGGTTRTITWT